jgi:hypothetical protein
MWPNRYTFYLGSRPSPLENLKPAAATVPENLGGGAAVTNGDKRNWQASGAGSSDGPDVRGIKSNCRSEGKSPAARGF